MINQKNKELGMHSSCIRQLFEYGKKRKQEIGEENVFDFSIGNPSVATPEFVTKKLIEIINNTDPVKLHGYTSASGDINVKNKIVNYLNYKYNASLEAKYMYMTCGAAASLTITLNAILNDKDEVIIFAPYFPEYKVFIEQAKGKVVIVNPVKETMLPNLNEFKNLINENTKAVIINSPNNPTGVVYNEELILEISSILKEKSNVFKKSIYLISDEPYRELIFEDIKYPFITNYYDDSIVCYSFSKSLSLPGERIGYIVLSSCMNEAEEVYYSICGAGRALGYVCAPSLFQQLVAECLGITSDINIYQENRDILYRELTSYGYEVIKPSGAFYLFVKALGNSSNDFSEFAKKYELLLVPSDSFGYKGFVRISYCVSKEQIIKSLPQFKKLYDDFKKGVNYE